MEKYKQEIQKEAKELACTFYDSNECRFAFEDGFISGINSSISERIRIEYAIEVLNNLSVDNGVVGFIENKITELKNKIK